MMYEIGAASVQGPKPRQQDAFFTAQGVAGLFDGHDVYGRSVAELVRDQFASFDEKMLTECVRLGSFAVAFSQVDAILSAEHTTQVQDGGSTGTLVVVNQGQLWTAWAGDSPAYKLTVGPESLSVTDLFHEPSPHSGVPNTGAHTVRNPYEIISMAERGYKIGGKNGQYFIAPDGDVRMLSRAFGDLWFEPDPSNKTPITPSESISSISAPPDSQIILAVGTDGALPVDNPEDETFKIIADQIHEGKSLSWIAEYVAGKNAEVYKDNATLVLARLSLSY